jgi:hypothetical protein
VPPPRVARSLPVLKARGDQRLADEAVACLVALREQLLERHRPIEDSVPRTQHATDPTAPHLAGDSISVGRGLGDVVILTSGRGVAMRVCQRLGRVGVGERDRAIHKGSGDDHGRFEREPRADKVASALIVRSRGGRPAKVARESASPSATCHRGAAAPAWDGSVPAPQSGTRVTCV